MPWKSKQQEKWGNSPSGHKTIGDAGVSEFNSASKGKRPGAPQAASRVEVQMTEKLYWYQDGRWWLYACGLPSFVAGWREVYRRNGHCTAVEKMT